MLLAYTEIAGTMKINVTRDNSVIAILDVSNPAPIITAQEGRALSAAELAGVKAFAMCVRDLDCGGSESLIDDANECEQGESPTYSTERGAFALKRTETLHRCQYRIDKDSGCCVRACSTALAGKGAVNLEAKAILTIEEAAELLGFSRQTATRLFEHEPGVLILRRPEKLHKRQYRCIRIPRPVFEEVRRRLEQD